METASPTKYRYAVRVIPAEGDERREFVHLPLHDTRGYYAALKEVVERFTGDPMEHVRVFTDFDQGTDFKYLDMFVNELGHMTGLPLNVIATAIYQHNVKFHEPTRDFRDLPVIVGDAVLFEQLVWR